MHRVWKHSAGCTGLKSMYKADDDNMAVLYITNATARFCSFTEQERKVNF